MPTDETVRELTFHQARARKMQHPQTRVIEITQIKPVGFRVRGLVDCQEAAGTALPPNQVGEKELTMRGIRVHPGASVWVVVLEEGECPCCHRSFEVPEEPQR